MFYRILYFLLLKKDVQWHVPINYFYLLLVDFVLEEDERDEEDLDSLLAEVLLPCEAEEPDLEEDELLEGVLTDLEGAEPEDIFVLLPADVGCSTLLLT